MFTEVKRKGRLKRGDTGGRSNLQHFETDSRCRIRKRPGRKLRHRKEERKRTKHEYKNKNLKDFGTDGTRLSTEHSSQMAGETDGERRGKSGFGWGTSSLEEGMT